MLVAEDTSKTNHPSQNNNYVRFTIQIPAHGKDGKMFHHILPGLRKLMTQNKLHGRLVHRDVEADWGDTSHQVHIIQIDGIHSGEMVGMIKDIAKAAKEMGELDGVYVTITPILEYFII